MSKPGNRSIDRKKAALLVLLLVTLVSVLGWQWAHREQPTAYVQDEVEHRALATFMEMMELGRLRGWRNTQRCWAQLPERKMQLFYQQLMGGGFRSEFTFLGSAPVDGEPERILLYGIFDSGSSVEVLMDVGEKEACKIIAIGKMGKDEK